MYLFKKALFLLHAIQLRFGGSSRVPRVPTVDTTQLPVYADNVLPSMLVHLGVLDPRGARNRGLANAFPGPVADGLLQTGGPMPKSRESEKSPAAEGPVLTVDEATALRAAAVDACERIVLVARALGDELEQDKKWITDITLPEVDGWLWSVAKDRQDYRQLSRFQLRNTVFF